MRRNPRPNQFFLLVAILALAPFLLGQNECQINQDLVNSLNQLVKQKFTPAPGHDKVYVTQLSFVDAVTRAMYAQTEESTLINNAVLAGIQNAAQTNPALLFNQPNHSLENTQANVDKLIELMTDENKDPDQRLGSIVSELMEPNGVDVIVTGTYTDLAKEDQISLEPIVINRSSRKALSKELKFAKSEYICPDPNNAAKKALCANTHEEIAKVVKELLEAL
jgi:hypothetical protein